MSLQLYQVDQRSYLLDFKSLVDEERKSLFLSLPPRLRLRSSRQYLCIPLFLLVNHFPVFVEHVGSNRKFRGKIRIFLWCRVFFGRSFLLVGCLGGGIA